VSEKLVLFQVAMSSIFPPSSPHDFIFKTGSKNNYCQCPKCCNMKIQFYMTVAHKLIFVTTNNMNLYMYILSYLSNMKNK